MSDKTPGFVWRYGKLSDKCDLTDLDNKSPDGLSPSGDR